MWGGSVYKETKNRLRKFSFTPCTRKCRVPVETLCARTARGEGAGVASDGGYRFRAPWAPAEGDGVGRNEQRTRKRRRRTEGKEFVVTTANQARSLLTRRHARVGTGPRSRSRCGFAQFEIEQGGRSTAQCVCRGAGGSRRVQLPRHTHTRGSVSIRSGVRLTSLRFRTQANGSLTLGGGRKHRRRRRG